jgi:hypothetical protein
LSGIFSGGVTPLPDWAWAPSGDFGGGADDGRGCSWRAHACGQSPGRKAGIRLGDLPRGSPSKIRREAFSGRGEFEDSWPVPGQSPPRVGIQPAPQGDSRRSQSFAGGRSGFPSIIITPGRLESVPERLGPRLRRRGDWSGPPSPAMPSFALGLLFSWPSSPAGAPPSTRAAAVGFPCAPSGARQAPWKPWRSARNGVSKMAGPMKKPPKGAACSFLTGTVAGPAII